MHDVLEVLTLQDCNGIVYNTKVYDICDIMAVYPTYVFLTQYLPRKLQKNATKLKYVNQ